jgi:hypothetical protein
MKTLFHLLLLTVPFFVYSQTIQYRMIDFTPFKYPAETIFWLALDSNKVEFDSLKSHCNSLYTEDITNNVISYMGTNGYSESGNMLDVAQTDLALMVEVLFANTGAYIFFSVKI